MYKLEDDFEAFYEELNPIRRDEMLIALLKKDDYKSGYALARTVFDMRHPKRNGTVGEVDTFLFNCVALISLYKGGALFKRGHKKSAQKIFKDMGCDLPVGELEESLLYLEMRNAIRRYFDTCKSSGYRRKLFGLVSSSESEKQGQLLLDAYKMSLGICKKFDLSEEMYLWNMAVQDEYYLIEPAPKGDLSRYKGK